MTVELNRGWNSRLGFSLHQQGNQTAISAIYADSVAARDGRLKTGDVIVEVSFGTELRWWKINVSLILLEIMRRTVKQLQCIFSYLYFLLMQIYIFLGQQYECGWLGLWEYNRPSKKNTRKDFPDSPATSLLILVKVCLTKIFLRIRHLVVLRQTPSSIDLK